jgi:DNA polymerase III gamma/tau subunit
MLSTSAFNALLKTLEEPPNGVIFILATTDPQKIPPTVHSRCQRFDFKRISPESMSAAIEAYLKEEGIACEPDAVRYVSRISDGSMRDALSILDQCAAFYMGETITIEKVMDITGAAGEEALAALLAALVSGSAAEGLDIIDKVMRSGRDIRQFTAEFISFLRDSLIALTAGVNAARILDLSEDSIKKLRNGLGTTDAAVLTRYISAYSELILKMRYSGNARILFEAEAIGLCRGRRPEPEASDKAHRPDTKGSETPKPVLSQIAGDWNDLINAFGTVDKTMLHATTAEHAGGNLVKIICRNMGIYEIIKSKREPVRAVIKDKYGIDADVEFILQKN